MADSRFTPLRENQLKKRYGHFFKKRRAIRPDQVPAALSSLTVYAEVWGIGDDSEREALVDTAPKQAVDDLVSIFSDKAIYAAFNDWLGDPGSDIYCAAYQGFSDLRLCYDSVKALRDWEAENKP